jgi:hypothetical protein
VQLLTSSVLASLAPCLGSLATGTSASMAAARRRSTHWRPPAATEATTDLDVCSAQPPTDGGVPRQGRCSCTLILPRRTKARAPRHACTVAIFFRPQPSRRPRPSPALLVYTSPQDDEGSSAPPLSCSRSSPAWARSPEDERNHGGRPVRMHPTRATRVYEVLPGHRQEGKRRKGHRGCIPAGRWEARTSSRS